MMRLLTLLMCGLLCAAPAAAQGVKSDQQTLIDLERRWNMAFHNGDVKFIESILHDDFIAEYTRRLVAALGDARPYFYPFKRILIWAKLPR